MREGLRGFYGGRRVLVTGHTGFKGGWLAMWLQWMGAEVAGCALPPEGEPSFYEAARVGEGIEEEFLDVRDAAAVSRFVRRVEPEVIFHLAAQPLVRRSYRDPVATYATNFMGMVHVLEAARRSRSVRAVVVVTSDKCYENDGRKEPYVESDPLGGSDPYSSSKACAEIAAAAYRRSYFESTERTSVATCRAGNVIGGGDWAEDRLVPDIIRALQADLPVVLRHPDAVRPWQHVLEPLYGYLLAARALAESTLRDEPCWNFGPPSEEAVTVGELAAGLVEYWGEGHIRYVNDGSGFKESQILRLDSAKARKELGWRSVLSLDEAIRMTGEWYRAHSLDPAGSARLTLSQIEHYFRLASTQAEPPGRDRGRDGLPSPRTAHKEEQA